jgi:hypothetical protein
MPPRRQRRAPIRYRTQDSDQEEQEDLYPTDKSSRVPEHTPSPSTLEINDVNYRLLIEEYRQKEAAEARAAAKPKQRGKTPAPSSRKRKRSTASKAPAKKRKKTSRRQPREELLELATAPAAVSATVAERDSDDSDGEEDDDDGDINLGVPTDSEEEAASALTSFQPKSHAQLESERFQKQLAEAQKMREMEQFETEELCWLNYKGLCGTADLYMGGDGSFEEVLEENHDIKKMFTICLRKDKDKVTEMVEQYSWWGLGFFTLATYAAITKARENIALEAKQRVQALEQPEQGVRTQQQQANGHFSDNVTGNMGVV